MSDESIAEMADPSVSIASAEGDSAAEQEGGAEAEKRRHRRSCLLMFLVSLTLVGGVVGLAAGLATRKGGGDDPGGSVSAATDGAADSDGVEIAIAEAASSEGGGGSGDGEGDGDDDVVEAASAGSRIDVDGASASSDPAVEAPGAGGGGEGRPIDASRVSNDEAEGRWAGPSPFPTPWDFSPWVEEETGRPTAPPFSPITPVVVDRSCDFEISQTVPVTAPGYAPVDDAAVEKKLSGGASAFDGNDAVVVSYDGDGSAGAVWALGRGSGSGGSVNGGTTWERTGTFQTDESDQLGWGVAVGGGVAVVGAPGHDGWEMWLLNGWYWAGRGVAVVMAKDAEDGSWHEEAILSPEVADDNAHFGNSVAIAECGCLIAVGAWHDRDNHGSVHVFAKNDDGEWDEIQKLAPDFARRTQSPYLHGNYGYTVAITDTLLAVKAPYDSYTNSYDWEDVNRGVVYLYERGGDGTFGREERLHTPEGTQVTTHLKDMVFLDDALLVGAPGMNRVYVFERTSSSDEEEDGGDDGDGVAFRKTAELANSDGAAGPEGYFGVSLSGGGSEVLVGERGSGTSYLFSHEGGTWRERAKFDGLNAALSGGTVVEHTPKTFEVTMDGERYGGDVNFYELVCEE